MTHLKRENPNTCVRRYRPFRLRRLWSMYRLYKETTDKC